MQNETTPAVRTGTDPDLIFKFIFGINNYLLSNRSKFKPDRKKSGLTHWKFRSFNPTDSDPVRSEFEPINILITKQSQKSQPQEVYLSLSYFFPIPFFPVASISQTKPKPNSYSYLSAKNPKNENPNAKICSISDEKQQNRNP